MKEEPIPNFIQRIMSEIPSDVKTALTYTKDTNDCELTEITLKSFKDKAISVDDLLPLMNQVHSVKNASEQ